MKSLLGVSLLHMMVMAALPMRMVDDAKGAIESLGDDAVLDDIENLPGFASFPTGAYTITLTAGLERKKINDHDAIEMAMTLDEVMEVAPENLDANKLQGTDGEEKLPMVGDICTSAFMIDNKFGVQKLKDATTDIVKRIGSSKISDLCGQTKGMKLLVVGKRTYDKDKDRFYFNLKKVQVL